MEHWPAQLRGLPKSRPITRHLTARKKLPGKEFPGSPSLSAQPNPWLQRRLVIGKVRG